MLFYSPVSKYKSLRLIRKVGDTSYYIAQCLHSDKTKGLKGKNIYIKQAIADRLDDKNQNPKNFKNEKDVYKAISKNNIKEYFATLYDFWDDKIERNHIFTLCTKYEELGDSKQFIEFIKSSKEKLDETDIMYIISRIMEAVLKLHEAGIIHRDIKPQNIFISEKFQIKPGDFGVSHIIKNNQLPTQKSGTYGYMSPACLYQKPYSFEVDVWSIGCVFYQLLYLKPLFSDKESDYQENIAAWIKKIEKETSEEYTIKSFMREFFKESSLEPLCHNQFMKKYKTKKHIFNDKIVQLYKRYMEDNNKDFKDSESYAPQFHQQRGLYNQKVLQAVHYPQWGYFLFTNNYKIIGCFNSQDGRIVRTYEADRKGKQGKNQTEMRLNAIFEYIKQNQFKDFIKRIGKDKLICQKRFECTVANLIQSDNTLLIKFQPENKRQIQEEQQQMGDIGFQNRAFQVFFNPRKAETRQGLPITFYHTSMAFIYSSHQGQNGSNVEIMVNELQENMYQETEYSSVENIELCTYPEHKNMLRHVKRILSVAWAIIEQSTGQQLS